MNAAATFDELDVRVRNMFLAISASARKAAAKGVGAARDAFECSARSIGSAASRLSALQASLAGTPPQGTGGLDSSDAPEDAPSDTVTASGETAQSQL